MSAPHAPPPPDHFIFNSCGLVEQATALLAKKGVTPSMIGGELFDLKDN